MTDNTGNEMGRNWGNKIRGAWNTVEGAGDKLRGGAMDFVDSATGTGGHHAETDMGNQKTQAGMAEMRGSGTSGTLGTAPQSAATSGTGTTAVAGSTASTGPAPALPARGGVTNGTGPVTDNSSGVVQ